MAPTVLKGLEHHAVFLLLLQLCILLATARLLGEVMRKLRQPPVVGELLAGVLLGPTVFGLAFPELQSEIFPAVQAQADLLSVVAWLGVLFLLIVTGFETDLRLVLQKGRSALLVSAGGILLPFATGFGLGFALPDPFLTSPDTRLVFALFMAVAMSISAVPVIAKVLFDLKLVRRDIGQLILASAMADDTIGWILLSVVAGLATRGSVEVGSVAMSVGAAVAFLLVAFTIGGRLVNWVITAVDKSGTGVGGQFSLVLVLAFGAAAFTQEMGIEAVLGAFVVGILARQAKRFRSDVSHALEVVTVGFAAPIFFASAGLKVDLVRLFDTEVLLIGLVVLLVACVGKMVGCYFGAWLGGMGHWERLALGSGMNARGAMEIIVATVGLGLGVLTLEMYSIIVMVAILTSVMAAPLLRWTISHVKMSEEEAKRLEREAIAVTSFGRSIRRVLVVANDEKSATLVSGLLSHLHKVQPLELTAIYANLEEEPKSWWQLWGQKPRDALHEFRRTLRGVRRAVRGPSGAAVEVKLATGGTAVDKVLVEAASGYDLVAMGASGDPRADGSLFGHIRDRLVRESPCASLVLRAAAAGAGGSADGGFASILVPTTGTEHSRRAVEIAALLSQGATARLTILHVLEQTDEPLPGDAMLHDRQRDIADDLVEQHVSIARKLGAEASGRIIEAASPEAAIAELIAGDGFDLVILGASARNVRHRAYFGRRVETLLKDTPCPIAVVCTG